jgi:hypothetical protein
MRSRSFVPGGGFVDPADGFHLRDEFEAAEAAGEPTFDTQEATVADVLEWVGDDKGRAQVALDAERDGKQRTSLVTELEAIVAAE